MNSSKALISRMVIIGGMIQNSYIMKLTECLLIAKRPDISLDIKSILPDMVLVKIGDLTFSESNIKNSKKIKVSGTVENFDSSIFNFLLLL